MSKQAAAIRWSVFQTSGQKRMRRAAGLLLCVLPLLFLCSCKSQRELNQLAIVVGTALDAGEEPDTIQLTTQIVKASEMGSGASASRKSGDKAYVNLTGTDKSVLSAVRGITHMQNRRLYFAHNDILIFSRDLAKLDIMEGLDPFIRDYESRMNVYILISKDSASEILEEEVDLEKAPSLHISGMMENQKANSETAVITLRDFAIATLSESTAPVAPMIELVGSEDNKHANLNGTAVFKQGKLVGELDRAQTRGLLMITNQAATGARTVDTQWGQVVLEIYDTKSKLKPEKTEDGSIRMRLTVDVYGAVQSNETTEKMSTVENVKMLEEKLKEAALSDIENVLAAAKGLSADVFGFGDAIRRDHPNEWDTMKDDWENEFAEMEMEVELNATLSSTGGLSQPVIPGGSK